MQRFARETQLSETSFVQSPGAPGADYRHRIFTVAEELPFAGHPSLGTAVACAQVAGETSVTYVQETRVGLQPIDVELAGATARASMLQEPPQFGAAVEPGPVLAALGLAPADAHPELPVQPVSTGIFHLMVPVRDAAALARARPVAADGVAAIAAQTASVVLYAFAVQGGDGGAAQARGFFAAGERVVEDPATGSAAGPLVAYLDRHAGVRAVTIAQGVELGRPSRLDAEIAADRVRVSGDCVIVLEGELRL